MPKIIRSADIWHSTGTMFEIVDNVDLYPEFLPWCSDSKIISCNGEIMIAEITIQYGNLRQSFTTRNERQRPSQINLFLEKGPFNKFEGSWSFMPITPHASEVTFSLDFTFSNWLVSVAIGKVFSVAAETMVDAFIKRADFLHADTN